MLGRVARHVFRIVCALSLLLCVAVCVLWAVSDRVSHRLMWTGQLMRVQAVPVSGGIEFVLSAGSDWSSAHQGVQFVRKPTPARRGSNAADIEDAMAPVRAKRWGPVVGFEFFACGP